MNDVEKSNKLIQAWYELNNHPKFANNPDTMFRSPCYIIDPVLETGWGYKSDNESENTVLRYWFEIIVPYLDEDLNLRWSHVYKLDDSADTYEDAILLIHEKMIEKYGPFVE